MLISRAHLQTNRCSKSRRCVKLLATVWDQFAHLWVGPRVPHPPFFGGGDVTPCFENVVREEPSYLPIWSHSVSKSLCEMNHHVFNLVSLGEGVGHTTPFHNYSWEKGTFNLQSPFISKFIFRIHSQKLRLFLKISIWRNILFRCK